MWRLLSLFRIGRPWGNRQVAAKSAAGAVLDSSPVPVILSFVFVWAAAAVLLTLSATRQRDAAVWKIAQKAPFTVQALVDFDYVDSAATEKQRAIARVAVPQYYNISTDKSELIQRNFVSFFVILQSKAAAFEAKSVYQHSGSSTLPERLAVNFSKFQELAMAIKRQGGLKQFNQTLDRLVRHGIISDSSKLLQKNQIIRVMTPDTRMIEITPPDVEAAANELAAALDSDGRSGSSESSFRISAACAGEFKSVAAQLLGSGNLTLDEKLTGVERQKAASAVAEIVRHCSAGDVIVEKNSIVTNAVIDMLNAERKAKPQGTELSLFYCRIGTSFLLLILAFFLLYHTYPKIFNSSGNFALGSLLVILAMVANYESIQLFFYLFRKGIIKDYSMLPNMIPISLCAALLAVLLGNRVAVFGVFTVSCVTALMIPQEQTLNLVIRWFFSGTLVALAVRNVTNYRTFFVRVFTVSVLSNVMISGDMLVYNPEHLSLGTFWTIMILNGFVCAVAALLLVFACELIFNTDTNMSLMVLCDYNHPLFEKLKREAPGTMFHCIAVATMAEDAARAIHANPLKAKAGALFHDIGKLARPQYFVENNVDSPAEYEKMPPEQCCAIIRDHVNDGLVLAKDYRLSRYIREAIASHHGDDLVSFFYERAKKEAAATSGENVVNEADFHYNGHPPVGKELTVISLADACEAACRSLNRPDIDEISRLVNDIFVNRWRNGQLRMSELSLRELEIVKECFITDLAGFNHSRIAYKKEKTKND